MKLLIFLILSFNVLGLEPLKTDYVLKKIEDNSIIWDESNTIHEYIKAQIRGVNPEKKNFEKKQLDFFAEGYLGQFKAKHSQFKKEYVTKTKSFRHEGNKYVVIFDYVKTNTCQLHIYELKSCGEPICGKEKDFNILRNDKIEEKYCDILYGKR